MPNLICLVKDRERYTFMWEDGDGSAVLQVFGRFAANPDLSFTWYDAAILAQKVRRYEDEAKRRAASK